MSKAKNPPQKFSERRMIENEVIFRQVNENVKDFLTVDNKINTVKKQLFYCECANPDCIEKIELTPAQYTKLHQNDRHFVTVTGHEFPEVEAVVSKEYDIQVVQKYDVPPSAESINLVLKTIKA